MKQRIQQLLIEIHRGFMPEDEEITDQEVLDLVPPNGLSPKANPNGTQSLVQKPFTYKWVAKRLKKDPTVTSYDLLVEAGFKEPTDD